MNKKWYNLFVSVDQAAQAEGEPAPAEAAGTASAAQMVADIAAALPAQPAFQAPAAGAPASFEDIYDSAEIPKPQHGYTVYKVADMLQSEHLRGLPAEVKRSSVLVALEAAGVKIQEVIEDAVRRDRALDGYERVLEKSVNDLEAAKTEENRKIQEEMERLVAEHRSRIEGNQNEVARERERFYGWRLQKQQEEKKISDAVSYFVTENPITTTGAANPPAPPKKV